MHQQVNAFILSNRQHNISYY